MVGVFVARCKDDGSYEKKQCHGSTGYCWCVDELCGEEIPGTRKGPGQDVDCSAKSKSKCKTEKAHALSLVSSGMLGVFVPGCKNDGSYEKKQCHESTRYCWCVYEQCGEEIPGSRKRRDQGDVDCSGKHLGKSYS
ncbi:equistatin-like [Hydractinia symbiolongicarpus]|uniref:equistatin-like n=1 Tax=Hydractinia symbiolongicarpus TaxID=13093 RepID=UPI00255088F9|nr:equistatin-like [Hydractinia symbiolongicarpus]